MNFEALLEYLAENWPQLAMQIGTLIMVILGKPKTAEQIQAKKEKALAKKHVKNNKLRAKLEQGYREEDQMAKALEEK